MVASICSALTVVARTDVNNQLPRPGAVMVGEKTRMEVTGESHASRLAGKPVKLTLEIVNRRYKRPFDLGIIFISLLLFPIWILLWAVIPLAIWLADRGPVFYTQERQGLNGKRFTMIKFRTMMQDAEATTGPIRAVARDSRVTTVGKILRASRLDEIPQLVNIVKGDMSLVGPRPERPAVGDQFCETVPGFCRRLTVRPGIAGLAQVRGHNLTGIRDKLRYDTLYIERMGPWLDIKLIFSSMAAVLKQSRHG